jgi:hypothetical protein
MSQPKVPDRTENLLSDLQDLIAEEMYLIGQELEDSLELTERRRLTELSDVLDRACRLLTDHRPPRPME